MCKQLYLIDNEWESKKRKGEKCIRTLGSVGSSSYRQPANEPRGCQWPVEHASARLAVPHSGPPMLPAFRWPPQPRFLEATVEGVELPWPFG